MLLWLTEQDIEGNHPRPSRPELLYNRCQTTAAPRPASEFGNTLVIDEDKRHRHMRMLDTAPEQAQIKQPGLQIPHQRRLQQPGRALRRPCFRGGGRLLALDVCALSWRQHDRATDPRLSMDDSDFPF